VLAQSFDSLTVSNMQPPLHCFHTLLCQSVSLQVRPGYHNSSRKGMSKDHCSSFFVIGWMTSGCQTNCTEAQKGR